MRIFSGTMNGEITEVAISVAPTGRLATNGAARMSYSAPGPGINEQYGRNHADRDHGFDQPVTQFNQMGDEGLLRARELVFWVQVGHQLNLCGR